MAKRPVFVSFDYDHDKRYKYLLEAWDANPDFDFVFADQTPDEINTSNIGVIKAALTKKINDATHTLVLVGKYANSLHAKHELIGYRNWIIFEIEKSKAGHNKIAAVKLDRENVSPAELKGAGVAWAMAFTQEAILRALAEAK